MKRLLPIVLVALATPLAAAETKVDFNYEIRPIISTKCFHCHGPDEKSQKAKLRLDVREDALKEHESGRTIVPGDPEASEFVKRITSTDPDEVMPPPKEKHTLSAGEIALLKKWIAQGAEYKEHWSFIKPVRPAVPAIADCRLQISELEKRDASAAAKMRADDARWRAWPRNAIDHFVLARMLGEGLAPSPEADACTLCRRLHLDLTGLPPSPEEVDAFVNATNASVGTDAAYEHLVETLLASPAFGERWAKMWLDLARYADSTG